MTVDKKRKRLTRAETVALKASKLTAIPLHVSPTESQNKPEDQRDAGVTGAETPVGNSASERPIKIALMKTELRELRKQLADKSAEYQALAGDSGRGVSKTVALVLRLLSSAAGASKAKLMAETGAKKGYVDALLNRILPAKGYTVNSAPVDGERSRVYRIVSEQHNTASE